MTENPTNLHRRYMAAAKAYREHADHCATCTPEAICQTGARLYEKFGRLQDAYNQLLREREQS